MCDDYDDNNSFCDMCDCDNSECSGQRISLQSYSLEQGVKYWDLLRSEYEDDGDTTKQLTEKCVFVISIMGLSISQLLGQIAFDNGDYKGETIAAPKTLFGNFIKKYQVENDSIIQSAFNEFIKVYDCCRHFGKTPQGTKHNDIAALTFESTEKHINLCLEVWRVAREKLLEHGETIECDEYLKELLSIEY